MNWVDIVLISILGLGVCFGAASGSSWQILRFFLAAVSLYATVYCSHIAQPFVSRFVSDPELVPAMAFIGCFATAYFTLFLISWMIEHGTKKESVPAADRMYGGAVGLVKGAVVAGAVLLAVVCYPVRGIDREIKQAEITPYILHGMRVLTFAGPGDYKQNLRDFLEDEIPAENGGGEQYSMESPAKETGLSAVTQAPQGR